MGGGTNGPSQQNSISRARIGGGRDQVAAEFDYGAEDDDDDEEEEEDESEDYDPESQEPMLMAANATR